MKTLIQQLLRKVGVQIKRYPDLDYKRRMNIVRSQNINVLFDVGANVGQYAQNMRELGYANKIVSFEPLSSAFKSLKRKSERDGNWVVNHYALGDADIESSIHVAGNSYSSSILDICPVHVKSAPESKYIGEEKIEIKRLDTVFHSFCDSNERNVMLKIDTQGYEKNVIEGAVNSLEAIRIIQVEMSLVQLYENEMLFDEMITYLEAKGFALFSLENGFYNVETGQLLQADGIFVKS